MQKLIFLNLGNIFINKIYDLISQADILVLFDDRELDHSDQLNYKFGSSSIDLKLVWKKLNYLLKLKMHRHLYATKECV